MIIWQPLLMLQPRMAEALRPLPVTGLANDINMSGFSGDFRCIGNAQHPFQGIFDGRGHTISNLNIVGNDNCGLFGTVSDGVQIRDFVFDSSCSIKGASYVGLVGENIDIADSI